MPKTAPLSPPPAKHAKRDARPGEGHPLLYPGEGPMKRIIKVRVTADLGKFIDKQGGSAYLRALAERAEIDSRII
jgi:hypothetical protein